MKPYLIIIISVLCFADIAGARAEASDIVSKTTNTNISQYLVDISPTPVTAGGLIGLTGSAITDVQSVQDLVIAFNSFSSDTSKDGFGIAITPARTDILPMSGRTYKKNSLMRLIGAATLSYAENTSEISTVSYRQSAVSLDASVYPDPDDDPIIKAAKLFSDGCVGRKTKDSEMSDFIAANDMNLDSNKLKLETLRKESVAEWDKCVNFKSEANKAKWNATKLSISFGAGWIKPENAAHPKHSLGKTATLGGIVKLGDDSAVYLTYRNTSHEIDLTTLSGTPSFKDSSLLAVRVTQGSENNGDLRWLAEYSDAKASSTTLSNDVFMYAVGIDKKVLPGVWLQFRVGRNSTADGTSTQTTSLLSLNWAPTSTLFSVK